VGTYTEFHFNIELIPDTPSEVLKVLAHMNNPDAMPRPSSLPEHPFFKTEQWNLLFGHVTGDMFPFVARGVFRRDNIGRMFINIRTDIRNHDDGIQKFVDWILPYVFMESDLDEFLGFYRSDLEREPHLIFGDSTT